MKKSKRKKAVALRYDALVDQVPRVTAKGSGPIADRIIALAEEHGVPVRQDPDLVEVLSRLDIKDEIPPEIYVAVAELLAFIYSMNSRKPSGM